jgi:hypothetical protein
MEAQELMIGNYVTFKGDTCKVVGIMPPYLDLVDLKGNQIYSIHEDDVEPIKITNEILDKLYIKGMDMINIYDIYYNLYTYMRKDCLDNLQRIYKLFYGVELELRL